ncbi:uncharacterized protein LOC113323939 [Papaver somniferum]|uniref:uncharacterized protein LOC113323939 n=1 Tax=Papaver somniferum TaxID=3469 RepID=UPI000E6FD5CB|nr:uncharacterized protein LOC113323939 [Papaver somniferum]
MSESISSQKIGPFGFDHHCVVSSVGRSGGLWMLWEDDIDIEIITQSPNMIHALVRNDGPRNSWHLFYIYGPPITNQGASFWSSLTSYVSNFDGCKSFIGDFNAIVSVQEKFGGLPVLDSNISAFDDFIHQNHLSDLGFSIPAYTWSNDRAFQGIIRKRLDRIMANPEWCISYHSPVVLHLPRISSDHAHILLNTSRRIARVPPNYKFEAYWISHPEFL